MYRSYWIYIFTWLSIPYIICMYTCTIYTLYKVCNYKYIYNIYKYRLDTVFKVPMKYRTIGG